VNSDDVYAYAKSIGKYPNFLAPDQENHNTKRF
jgi:hypothetical protein